MKNRIRISGVLLFILTIFLVHSCKKENVQEKVTDIDGNVYKTVTIGTQVWMAENLKTTKYRNGDLIGTTTPPTKDILSESTPKYQWAFGGIESNAVTYGRLYTWYTVADSRNVCPTGFHLPTDAEWTTLTIFFGGEYAAGGSLKETGTTHWATPNLMATDVAGFTALPGGYRYSNGSYNDIGLTGSWWSSTEYSITDAWYKVMFNFCPFLSRDFNNKHNGYSVRCIMD
jgi:uncharacterized protein (TIGR02145 family)